MAAFWDDDRNNVSPAQVLAGSTSRRHWRCPKCGHSWQASVAKRVILNSGCPACIRKSQSHKKQPTLTESRHPVMAEFDYELNSIYGFDADEVTLGSKKMVYWICSKCPQGKLHRWQASPQGRSKGQKCPYCSSRRACICNSLQTHFPHIAKEWDWERNELTPDQVTARSHFLAFWKTADGRSWEQTVNSRTASAYIKAKEQSLKMKSAKSV